MVSETSGSGAAVQEPREDEAVVEIYNALYERARAHGAGTSQAVNYAIDYILAYKSDLEADA